MLSICFNPIFFTVLLSDGETAFRRRPKDISAAFGVDLGPNFLVVRIDRTVDSSGLEDADFETLNAAFGPLITTATVVATCFDTIPFLVGQAWEGMKLGDIVRTCTVNSFFFFF